MEKESKTKRAIAFLPLLICGAQLFAAELAADPKTGKEGEAPWIVIKSAPNAVVLLPENSGELIRYAGHELQNFIFELTGAKLPVCGQASMAKTTCVIKLRLDPKLNGNDETFSIIRSGNEIVCTGKTEAGLLYACYELLERLGVVFQIAGNLIPERKPDLQMPELNLTKTPEIESRGYAVSMLTAPWIGGNELKLIIDQMARMKLNSLMIWGGISSPIIDFEIRGERNLLGDQNAIESGYLAWRCATGNHTPAEMSIGRDLFSTPRACADEFQHVQNPEEAKTVARKTLNDVIEYAHSRNVSISLAISDLPCVPNNLARHRKYPMHLTPWYGAQPSPGDPVAEEAWLAMLDRLMTDYPGLDDLWIFMSEGHRRYQDDASEKMAEKFRGKYGDLVPSLEEIKAAGLWRPTTNEQLDYDFALLNLAEKVVGKTQAKHPGRTIGIAWCGRLYLFRMMDAVFPKNVPLLSLEASICWNKGHPVPLHWGQLKDRKTFIMPRLDDDVNTFGPQWNVGLYRHDRVLDGARDFGYDGVLAQVPIRVNGLEHNADFLARGAWNADLTEDEFYREYSERLFGGKAAGLIRSGFAELEKFETFLGQDAKVPHGNISYFSGLMNFVMYYDSPEITTMSGFRDLKKPFDGPAFPGHWDVNRFRPPNAAPGTQGNKGTASDLTAFEGYDDLHAGGDAKFVENSMYRLKRFQESLQLLRNGRTHFETARAAVPPGSASALDYMIYKIDTFERHIKWVCKVLETYLSMDKAYYHRACGNNAEMLAEFDRMLSAYDASLAIIRENLQSMSSSPYAIKPDERFLIFRYNVRFYNPSLAFRDFIANLRNFHCGVAPYWTPVDWSKIRLIQFNEM
jgi:hypothetical protein